MERTLAASDGTRLRYTDQGAAVRGTIVLCHGLAASGRQFAADAEHWAARGWRVIVPDLRGHGRSGKPADLRAGFGRAVLAEDTRRMLDAADAGPVHWVGNSLGGIVGLELAQRQPQALRSLALFGTALSLRLPAGLDVALLAAHRALGRERFARWLAHTSTHAPGARPVLEAMAQAFDPQVAAALVPHLRHYDLEQAAAAFGGPLLVLVGGRDRLVNLSLKPALKRLRPSVGWQVVDLPQGGHCANLDATQAWRDALERFWAGPAGA